MDSIALTGSDPETLSLMRSVMRKKGYETPWIVWDSTVENPPLFDKLITYKACVYAAECMILATHRILDRENMEYIWIVDTDELTVKDLDGFLKHTTESRTDDVVLGIGFSRFSRKALENISRDFGTGLDYTGLAVVTLDSSTT